MLSAAWLACALFAIGAAGGRALSATMDAAKSNLTVAETDTIEKITFALEADDLDDDDDDDDTDDDAAFVVAPARCCHPGACVATTMYGERTSSLRFALGQRLSLQRPPRSTRTL
jgi:hypothetical protein